MKIQELSEKILRFGEEINKIKLRSYQWKRSLQTIKAVILNESGTFSTLWCRKSGKSEMLKVTMLSLMTLLPNLARTYLVKEFPRLKLFRDGLHVAFAGPKLDTARIPFRRLRRQGRQKALSEKLESLNIDIIASNSNQFELSNGSLATAFSGSETASNEGPGAHCLGGDTIIITNKGKVKIRELISRYRKGEKFDILSVGKGGLEFKKCLAVSSEIKKRSLELDFSNKENLVSGYEHPIFSNDQYYQAEELKVGQRVCDLNNFKLSLVQHLEMDQSVQVEELNLVKELNKKTTYFVNTTILKIWQITHQNYKKMLAGVRAFGDSVPKLVWKLKNFENRCIQMGKELLQSLPSTNSLLWDLQFGGRMMEATRMETGLFIPNVLLMKNMNYFRNILLKHGNSRRQSVIAKNEEKSFIFLVFQKSRILFFQLISNLMFFLCYNTKSENLKNAKYVERTSFAEAGLILQLNAKKKQSIAMINYVGKKIEKLYYLFVPFAGIILQALKITPQRPAPLSVIGNKRTSFSETGDLEQELPKNQKVRITHIKHSIQERELFDLMVEENHNYFANGILVHNCILIDEAQALSPFSMYKILRPMVAHVDGLISLTGTCARKKCPFLTDIEYNKQKFPHLHQEVPYTDVTPFSKDYASFIDGEIDRLPGGMKNPFFRMNYLLHWLIAEGHFVDTNIFLKLATATRGPSGGRLAAGVDWGKIESATTVTILEDRGNQFVIVDLFEIKGDWDHQFKYLIPFLKEYPLQVVYSESNSLGDPLSSRLKTEFSKDKVEERFMSSTYKDLIFTNLETEITAKPSRFSYFDDDSDVSKSFIRQFLDAEKEIKGKLLSVHKPKEEGAADDFLISTALALDALRSTPIVTFDIHTLEKKRGITTELENL